MAAQNYLAIIKVVGIGGGGVNAVNRMIEVGLKGVEFIAINTDAQPLLRGGVDSKILIGRSARGMGAGGDPEKGEQAAFESEKALKKEAEECDLAFITAGLGGGTGTGSAHVIARLARAANALTIAVVTYPFLSEGALRRQ